MNSLTTKRFVQYQSKFSDPHHSDDVEPKLDSLITNTSTTNTNITNTNTKLDTIYTNITNTNTKLDSLTQFISSSISGVLTLAIPIVATQYSSVIDIGVQSQLYTFIWLGTKDSTYLNYSIEASSDNITYFPYTRAVFTETPTSLETHYLMPFRYHKLKVFNNNASTAANTNLHYGGRI